MSSPRHLHPAAAQDRSEETREPAYNSTYYDGVTTSARSSSAVVVPLVTALVGVPDSVVDVGCGRGSWLATFTNHGTRLVVGVDAPHIPGELEIPLSCFIPHDLEVPLQLDQHFDLAISLEVAEHLPRTCADSFVASLTRLSDVVLFSAAIPGQGGLNHVNEQWQEHWAQLFSEHGYVPLDCLRDLVWGDIRVEWWYAQNMLLYFAESRANQTLLQLRDRLQARPLNLVHPENYIRYAAQGHLHAISRVPRP